jgi:hypothetical protein
MAPKPYSSASYFLELDFQPDSGDSARPQEADASDPKETHHAVRHEAQR